MRKKKALVFVNDPFILDLVEEILLLRDFEVVAHRRPVVCPVYHAKAEGCGNTVPCADVLILDREMLDMDGFAFLLKQYERGCQMDIRNKAVIADYVAPDDVMLIDYIGFKLLKKPFTLTDVSAWLEECEQRIDAEMVAF